MWHAAGVERAPAIPAWVAETVTILSPHAPAEGRGGALAGGGRWFVFVSRGVWSGGVAVEESGEFAGLFLDGFYSGGNGADVESASGAEGGVADER